MFWQKYPLLRILIPFIMGMIVADKMMDVLCDNVSVIYVLLCCCAAFLYTQNRQYGGDFFNLMFGVAAILFFFVLGMMLFVIRFDTVRNISYLPDDKTVKGIVTEPPVEKRRTWAMELETGDIRVLAYIQKTNDSTVIKQANIGDTLVFRTRDFVSTCPLDLNKKDNVFAGYRRYLFNNGISATCYVAKGQWELLTLSSEQINVMRTLSSWRKEMSATYHKAGFEGDEGALIEALTTGDKTVLSKELKNDYARAGVSHILALSGFHLSVIYAMLNLLLFGRFVLYRWWWVKSVLIILCLWVFTFMAGAPPSLVRAAIMCSLMSVSSCLGRRALSINSMTFAATMMLVANPLVLMDVGFQLSFVSVLGICVCAVPLCRYFSERLFEEQFTKGSRWILLRNSIGNSIIGVVVVSAVCSVFTAPLVAYHFHSVPVLSVLTNLLVCSLSVLILYVAGLWWIVCWWEWMRGMLTEILSICAAMMNSVAEWVSSFEWATVEWNPSFWSVSISYLLIGGVVSFFHFHKAWCVQLFLVSIIGLSLCGIFNL